MPAAAKRILSAQVRTALARGRAAAAAKPAREREGMKKLQAWLPAEDVRALKQRALDRDTTVQALVAEAISAFLRG